MAIAMPPSVIVLMVMPSSFIAKIATTSESGIATTEIAVARKFQRKRNRMMTTRIAPSRSACITFSIDTDDEVGLPEQLRVDLHAFGQRALHRPRAPLDALA